MDCVPLPMSPSSSFSSLEDAEQTPMDVRIGRWSKQEHAKFMEGYKMFGKDWRRVAEYVGTRNNVQVRTHAQKSFKKMRKLELAKLKTQRIIAAHKSGLSDIERARVLEHIETATRMAMEQKNNPSIPSKKPSLNIQIPSTSAPGVNIPGLSHPQENFLGQGLLSPLLLPPPQHFKLLSNPLCLPPLEVPATASLTSSAASSAAPSPPPSVFSLNGTVFPHLAAITTLSPQQLQPAPANRFSFQNHFKFVQDWSVDVK